MNTLKLSSVCLIFFPFTASIQGPQKRILGLTLDSNGVGGPASQK